MTKKLKLNVFYLLVLFCVGFVVLSFIFQKQAHLQLEIATAAVFIYVSFSLTHHYFDKSLTFETSIEYILIALLAVVVLMGIVS